MIGGSPRLNQREAPVIENWTPGTTGGGFQPPVSSKNTGERNRSPVAPDDTDRAIILNEEGERILTRLNPEGHREQSRTKIIGSTWAHPAFAGNRVFARSDTELVCVSLEVPSE